MRLRELCSDERLGEHLVQRGKLRSGDLARVSRVQQDQAAQEGDTRSLSRLLVRLGMVGERDMAESLAELLGLPLVTAIEYPDVNPLAERVSERFLKEHLAIPIAESEDCIELAVADPGDEEVCSAVALACGKAVTPLIGVPSEIEAALGRLSGEGKTEMGEILEGVEMGDEVSQEDVEQLRDLASEAPVIRLVNVLIRRAVELGASDIHIEPFDGRLKLRYRLDGILQEQEAPPPNLTAAIISRLKIMAKLDIAERRLAQDGRIRLKVQGQDLDIRVSTVPTIEGESVVMRLLNQEHTVLDFVSLGFTEDVRKRIEKLLKMPHGMILVTGPTGSGKTTTLYTALQILNQPERMIITVEDPVEYQIAGINQIQVKPQIGLSFASALRSIVRQDPDVILVGEMRDLETARICVQAALTGHLVLSTLHTNDAASSITRLNEMGVEDYLLNSTVNAVLAQRLVRVLCLECREPYEPLPELVEELQLRRYAPTGSLTLHRAKGCQQCNGTGYRGRRVIHELLVIDDEIRRLVLQGADAVEIEHAAIRAGMRSMHEDGLHKALEGTTSLEEVVRVTRET
jgi:general secretion pathway protein E